MFGIKPGQLSRDQQIMRLAMHQARMAFDAGEVPVGAAVIAGDEIIGLGNNRTRRDGIVHAHAELVALAEAQRFTGDFRLDNCEMYVTVEPCMMCLGAIMQARIERIAYGAPEPKFGALVSRFKLLGDPSLDSIEIVSGVLADEAAEIMGSFFRKLRGKV